MGRRSPVLVQAAMGHASFKTTEEYLHLIKDHMRELVAERTDPANAGQPAGRRERDHAIH